MSQSVRGGFTRVELLVLSAIVLVLIFLFLPGLTRRIRPTAARMACQNYLKYLMLGIHQYESTHGADSGPTASANASGGHTLPPGCLGPGTTPEDRLSWMVALLPYLEQESLYRKVDLNKGYTENLEAVHGSIPQVQCPASKEAFAAAGLTSYIAMAGIGPDAAKQPAGAAGNGFMGYDRLTKLNDITDGLENTIALIETRSGLGPWARGGPSTLRGFDPNDVPLFGEGRPFGGMHTGGMNAGMADGSVRFIRSSIDPKKLAAVITIAGGERVDLD